MQIGTIGTVPYSIVPVLDVSVIILPYSLHRYLYDSISVQSDGVIVVFLWETVGLDPVQRIPDPLPSYQYLGTRYRYRILQILTDIYLSCRIRTRIPTDLDLDWIWIWIWIQV
jgi:hypothetical protein